MWDYAHRIDLAEADATEEVQAVENMLDLAQKITVVFRYGKEYKKVIVGAEGDNECVSLRGESLFLI